MPRLSRWSIRIAIGWLVAGWGLGAMLMISRAWNWQVQIWLHGESHVAMMLFGWTLQFVIAVAYWILPTFGGRSNRGRTWPAVLSVVLINVGVFSVIFGSPVAVGLTLWIGSAAFFGLHAWPRVKAFGR